MRDYIAIVRRNLLSPIVIAILLLASALLALGEWRDAFFISIVILVNTLFAIFQEIRARRALKKLELLSAPHARRQLPDGSFEEVLYDHLVMGDIIRLQAGDDVPADATLLKGNGLEVNESILTGESASIEKQAGDEVLAGSAVVAGGALAKVVAVGVDSKAGQMTATLKRYVPQQTPLQRAIARAITWLTYGALFLAALIFVVYSITGRDAVSIFKTITSAAVTVVPEGLILASSLLLAFGSLKLAQARVLPQKLAAIEAMALLSVLCVDKTGTLTSDTITLEDIELFDTHTKTPWKPVIAAALDSGEPNATAWAVLRANPAPENYDTLDTLAFSSSRKMSGARVRYDKKTYTVLMGAPEFVEPIAPLSRTERERIEQLTARGLRVLLVASFADTKSSLKDLQKGTAIGFVILSNPLREGVQKTVRYLQKNDVRIRVISGDNPKTVQYIAAQAGIKNSQVVVTGVELAALDAKAWEDTVQNTTIFARVLPEQKERLVATLQKGGDFVGMVGDGVNDALALKKADLGVAMYDGAAASRRVADIVLLNNSFTSLPLGMRLGNKVMQAIELIAVLFFHKIIYGVVLLMSTLALGTLYPFLPRHVTFMNIFLVTMPTLMWTLFPPRAHHRVNPEHFWRDTLAATAPIAALSGIGVSVAYWLLERLHPAEHTSVTTLTVIIATFFGVYLVFLASRMLGVVHDTLALVARMLYLCAVGFVATASFGVGFLRDFFDFTRPNWPAIVPVITFIVGIAIAQYALAARAGDRLKQKHYRI